jgi:hypothetical protein
VGLRRNKMNNWDDRYLNRKMPDTAVENTAVEQVDSLFMWLGRVVGLVIILAAVGYVIGGML